MPAGDGGQGRRNGVRDTGGDAVQLTIDYVKQEALGPVKAAGRFVVFGVVATTLASLGSLLVLVGVLRLLQTETGSTFAGDLSWVPYLIVSLLALLLVGLAAWRIVSGPAERQYPRVAADLERARAAEERGTNGHRGGRS